MYFRKKLKYYIKNNIGLRKYLCNQKDENAKLNHLAAELTRNTHSIEKGLSIQSPRLGFGHKKHKEMMEEIQILQKSSSPYHREACIMALDAIKEYLEYHDQHNYIDDFIISLKDFVKNNDFCESHEKMGGTMVLNKSTLDFDIPSIEHFFDTRHSIRDFDESEVDGENLKRALELAQKAPSACNRQGVRAYVLDNKGREKLISQLSGIGGFAQSVNKFVLITAKTSAYRIDENNQYIVSASMYAAYLTLTLHLYGMGACVVQRPVIWNKEWENNRQIFGIDKDEQLICLLAVGNLKDSCVVPISHRMKNSEMIRFL